MRIKEACELLKMELLDNGYEYGFYRNQKTYKPDMAHGFDKEYYHSLLTEYRVQNPIDTMRMKVGTCNDVVILMKFILNKHNITSKIWLLNDKRYGKFHTILTFTIENKTVYLELTPQSGRPCYGKEIVFEDEESFIAEYKQNDVEVINVTNEVIIGKAPDFLLSRMV